MGIGSEWNDRIPKTGNVERSEELNFKERFGCFFLAVGSVTFLLFAIPVIQAFQNNPATVPAEWIGVALAALLVLWAGWRLYTSARRAAESQKPPSLGTRLAARWKSGGAEDGEDQQKRRG